MSAMLKFFVKINFLGLIYLFISFYSICFAGTCGSWGSDGKSPWIIKTSLGGADSVAFDDVKYAVETVAQNGDIVYIPAGTATDWTPQGYSNAAITVPAGVTVIGAGIGKTIISTPSGVNNFLLIQLRNNSRIEGLEFTNGGIGTVASAQDFAVLYCKMVGDPYDYSTGVCIVPIGKGGSQAPAPTGVYSHCSVYNIRFGIISGGVGGNLNFYEYYPDWDTTSSGTWRHYVVYFEDCDFHMTDQQADSGDLNDYNNNWIDASYGAGAVLRFSALDHAALHNHSGDTVGATFWHRGPTVYSAYENTFTWTNIDLVYGNENIKHRGGTGMYFNNSVTVTIPSVVKYFKIDYQYDSKATDEDTSNTVPHPISGDSYMVRGAPGNGKDLGPNIGNTFDMDWDYEQEARPLYIWKNTYNGGETPIFEGSGPPIVDMVNLKEGRDYILDSTSVSGYSEGMVTSGTLDSAPPCNAASKYYGHWATDKGGNWNKVEGDENDGAFYQCNGVSWELYWTPLDYPHPLAYPLAPVLRLK